MEPKLINNEAQYKESLAEIGRLASLDPKEGSAEAQRLELFATLVQTYEKNRFFFSLPEPIAAIRFRMEEQGLSQTDLIPYIGSRSKVSEVLSGKRTLTLQMIRALNSGLGIPAAVLLKQSSNPSNEEPEYEKFPIKEMVRRGWVAKGQGLPGKIVQDFLSPLHGYLPTPAKWRRTIHERSGKEMDKYALFAWSARVLIKAAAEELHEKFDKTRFTEDLMRELAGLSQFDQGPLLAKEFLAKHGVILIIEPHLPKTRLDGAALLAFDGRPVIGLTLRYDRIDAFWFNLMHECMHVMKHLHPSCNTFFDDLDLEANDDPLEKEADRFSREIFIPRQVWSRSPAFRQRTLEAVTELAKQLKIHPAIIAGRIRYEAKNFNILNQLVGHGQVRKLFSDIAWEGG